MHIIITYNRSDMSVVSAFETNTVITEMNVLKIPEVNYLVTIKRDALYRDKYGKLFLDEKYVK